MKVETFQAMGAVPVKDGIVFSMERKNNEEASLLLYKKGSNGDLPLMMRDYKNPLLFKEDYTNERVADIIKKFLSLK